MQKIRLITIVFLSFCPLIFFAQQNPLSAYKGDSVFRITKLTSFKEDKTSKLGLAEVQKDTTFKEMTGDIYKLGGSNPHNIWVKFDIKKETNKDILLELSTGITDTVYLYAVNPKGEVSMQRIGKYFPYAERLIKNNLHVFLLNGKKDELTRYYLNMRSVFPLSIRLRLGTNEAFAEEYHASDLLHGIFIGIVFIVALFNLFFFISLREGFYICYVGYAFFIMCTVLRFDGYLFQYIHPKYPELNVFGFYFHGLAGVFGIYFARNFLKTKIYTPKLDKGLLLFLAFYVLNICFAALGLYKLNILSVYAITFPFNLFLIYTGIQVYKNGYLIARFFVGGVFALMIGITIFTLHNIGFLETNVITKNVMYIGIALEAILFFGAIVDRFSVLRQEKNDAQMRMIKSLQENKDLMTQKNKLLEEHAHDRSVQLEMMKSQLSGYAEKLIKSNQELTDFAHIASHDLRAPIRNIGSFTQLLEKRLSSQLDERSKEYLDFIKTNVRQSTKLIEDLLNYSKIDKNIGAPQPVELSKVLILVNNNLQSFIVEKKAQIIADDLPMLNGHTSLLVQLFQNLINNGLKYNKNEMPIVRIATEWQGNELIFKVIDNGIGIAPQYQEQIFGMFRRLHSSAEYEGSGIGLAFCQRIVSTYNGRIWLESEEGKGTTFFFTLPEAVISKPAKKEDKTSNPSLTCASLPDAFVTFPSPSYNQKEQNVLNNHARSKSNLYPTRVEPAFVDFKCQSDVNDRVIPKQHLTPYLENATRFAPFDMEKLFRKTSEKNASDTRPPTGI